MQIFVLQYLIYNLIGNSQYIYQNDSGWPSDAFVGHHVFVRSTFCKGISISFLALILFAIGLHLFLQKGTSTAVVFLSYAVSAFFALLLLVRKPVKQETVIIMPGFGVQLETHHSSGKIAHRFIPMGKILKPVLVECVTPVTCYWSLSLIVRGEEELTLVFKNLRPPLKMLLPIWKALRAAIDHEEGADSLTEHLVG